MMHNLGNINEMLNNSSEKVKVKVVNAFVHTAAVWWQG